jgi:hypothetical protein
MYVHNSRDRESLKIEMAVPSTEYVNFKYWPVIIYFSSAVQREFVLEPNFLE